MYELPKKLSSNFYTAFEGRLTTDDMASIPDFDFGCYGKEKAKVEVDKAKIKTIVDSNVELPWPNRNVMIAFVKLLYKEIGPHGMHRLTKHLIKLCHSRRAQDVPFCGQKPEFWRQFNIKSKERGLYTDDPNGHERSAKRPCVE